MVCNLQLCAEKNNVMCDFRVELKVRDTPKK